MNYELLAQAGAGALVGSFAISKIVDLVKHFIDRRSDQAPQIDAETRAAIAELREDVAQILTVVRIVEDREKRLMDRTIPALESTQANHARRLAYVETDLATLRSELGKPARYTPPSGVPVLIDE